MVFTKLSTQEKDAFFGLLDEYFQSRPELLGQRDANANAGGLAGTSISTAAAASVVQRAFAANTTNSSGGAKSNNPYISATPSVADVAHAVPVGRVAAASLAFSQAASAQTPSPSVSASPSPGPGSFLAGLKPVGDGPPTLPRRGSSNVADQPGSEVDKLVTRKTGVFNTLKKQQATPGVGLPSAFSVPKNTFGPPPVRRTTSDTAGGGATGGTLKIGSGAVPPAPQRPEPEEEVAEGEWAEALYDYSSQDPGDLTIEVGMRVWVTARSSEDWWTGQVEGQEKEGLFPASYVKLL